MVLPPLYRGGFHRLLWRDLSIGGVHFPKFLVFGLLWYENCQKYKFLPFFGHNSLRIQFSEAVFGKFQVVVKINNSPELTSSRKTCPVHLFESKFPFLLIWPQNTLFVSLLSNWVHKSCLFLHWLQLCWRQFTKKLDILRVIVKNMVEKYLKYP